MKLNLVLLTTFVSLLGLSYFVLESDAQETLFEKRIQSYLIPIDSLNSWSLDLPLGRLSLREQNFLWNERIKIDPKNKNFLELYTRLRDLKIVEKIPLDSKQSHWDKNEQTQTIITFKAQGVNHRYHIGSLNRLTGRMKVLNIDSQTVYIIDDESVLLKPYKSVEVGQEIKYSKLLKALKESQWDKVGVN